MLNIDHTENITFIPGMLTFCNNTDSELYNDLLEKALIIMETPEGRNFLRFNFSILSIYSNIYRQRGQMAYYKRLYHVMKDIYQDNYKTMSISDSLMFIMADYDFTEENTEIANMVFQNIIKQVNNIELESIHEVFTSLGQLLLTDQQKSQLR